MADHLVVTGDRLPRDTVHGDPIQAPSRWQAGTDLQKSPKTISNVEQFLDPPENAVSLVLTAVGADLRVAHGKNGTATTGNYTVILASTSKQFPVANRAPLYLLRNASTDVTLYIETWFIGTA